MAREDSGPAGALIAAWFGLRAEDPGAAAVTLHALRNRAARIVAARCRCGFVAAEDAVADAVSVMVYGIRRAPRLRIPDTTTLAYLCGVAGKNGAGTGGDAGEQRRGRLSTTDRRRRTTR